MLRQKVCVCVMSYAHYFRVKAELFELLHAKSENSVDRAWYGSLMRSYALLAASEDRHYYQPPQPVPSEQSPISIDRAAIELDGEIERLLKSRSAA